MTLLEEFIKKKIITTTQSFSIINEIDSSEKTLDQVLLSSGISPDDILDVKKEYFKNIPFNIFNDPRPIADYILDFIPVESAERYKIVPLGVSSDDYLEVGMLNPEDLTAKTILQFISTKIGKPYKIYLIS
jgi:hypothetical protein